MSNSLSSVNVYVYLRLSLRVRGKCLKFPPFLLSSAYPLICSRSSVPHSCLSRCEKSDPPSVFTRNFRKQCSPLPWRRLDDKEVKSLEFSHLLAIYLRETISKLKLALVGRREQAL